jgi:hypothetical protein
MGGSCSSRDGEQGQRRHADPRGTPPLPHHLRSPRATRSPRPRSLPQEWRRRRKRPNAASGNGRCVRGRRRRRLGSGRRGAGSAARVLARRRIRELLRREGVGTNRESWSSGATTDEVGTQKGEGKKSRGAEHARTRMGGDGDKIWFHRSIAGTVQAAGSGDGDEAEEEKAFLVPSAAAFPHGMSAAAAGPSLAVAKKEEFSKSPSNSPASSGGTDGGSSAVPWPEQIHAQNSSPTLLEPSRQAIPLE